MRGPPHAVAGLVLLIAALLARPAGALELPVRAEGARVVVRAQEGMDRAARALAGSAERHLAGIEEDLRGLPRIDRVEVRLVRRMEDVAAAAPPGRGAPPWAAGTAYPDEGIVVVAARGRRGELLDFDRTMAHELAHMALDRALGGNVTRWLTEGFAYLHSSDFSWGRAQTLFGAVVGGKLIPLHELDHRFPAHEDEVSIAYAQSYDFVAWLADRGRWPDPADDGDRWAFRRFLAELAAGTPINQAARRAYGRTLAELEAEWLEDIRGRYLWYPAGIGFSLIWVLGGVLLVLAWRRRRRQGRARIRQWELEDDLARAAALRDEDRLN